MALRKVQREHYKNDVDVENMVNAEVATFRPTFLLDEGNEDPYIEEEYSELRIGNVMFR